MPAFGRYDFHAHAYEDANLIHMTSHHPLNFIRNLPGATGKLACWRLSLQEYAFEIVHQAVVKYQAVDKISRLQTAAVENTELEDEITIMAILFMKSYNDTKPLRSETQKE